MHRIVIKGEFCVGYHSDMKLQKASFTLEAAVVIPLVTGFLVVLLMFFRILQIQTLVQEAIVTAGRKTAVMAADSGETWEFVNAQLQFRKCMEDSELITRYVQGGSSGILLEPFGTEREFINMRASYRVQMPVSFFYIKGVLIRQAGSVRKWTGSAKGGVLSDEDWVYVTPDGEAYHSTKRCRYLDLSIKSFKTAEIRELRNKDGEKYRMCDWCVAEISDDSWCYVTDYGQCYHQNLRCSGLKRTIYRIRRSDTGGRKGCSKCAK